ncbi:similar to Saccharomyces cerevisiae YPR056W TFB4 Subunit of TFIIH complex, involved in transcription initiation, similar to 34 kDa subunit of human TFIIH [Maudiozyma saulgeensis]|uniref:General transcription and DNA repair factor IIH subunit TFB4 n=1 Tax=Maudiozyma saulgeensis TaxID=1789683 RepID=A0A1X7R555_9SACH|nr:similar to Saccharomyces cerevisiae YPR056W TFB4 Subunit of TFIIH complex, involved in transcription initiation, similar to 34 kDa subunit of human TFIIH [Kazachstania saulgeensis]
MDAIADPNFKHQTSKLNATEESPSLLTVIIDITPQLWTEFDGKTGKNGNILDVLRSLIVFLNAHLAFNISNQVAVIAAHSQGIKYLYPTNNNSTELSESEDSKKPNDLSIISKNMYRRFRNVDETLVEELYTLFKGEEKNIGKLVQKSTLAGAMSAALAYTDRITREMESISLQSRIMVITCGSDRGNREEIFQYIPIMNCIFSATKIKCPIDVVKVGGSKESTFLQQTTDATNGIYLHVVSTDGLLQYFSTAMFINPSLRQIIVKPNKGSVDFRTSCYITGRVVAVGYICSVCLCVLSIIPPGNKCPACDSEFDERVIAKLKKRPVVPRLAKKKSSGNISK